MNFCHFPKAQINGSSTGNRDLYLDPLNVDSVFQDSDKPNITAIISNGTWQWVEMPVAQVIKILGAATVFEVSKGGDVKPVAVESLPNILKEIKKS